MAHWSLLRLQRRYYVPRLKCFSYKYYMHVVRLLRHFLQPKLSLGTKVTGHHRISSWSRRYHGTSVWTGWTWEGTMNGLRSHTFKVFRTGRSVYAMKSWVIEKKWLKAKTKTAQAKEESARGRSFCSLSKSRRILCCKWSKKCDSLKVVNESIWSASSISLLRTILCDFGLVSLCRLLSTWILFCVCVNMNYMDVD